MRRKFKVLRTIGKELRTLRRAKDITIAEVADKVGISTTYMSEIERDLKSPSDEVIIKLSNVLEVPEVELFDGFNKIPESVEKELLDDNPLLDILYEISNEPIFTKKEKKDFYKTIMSTYDTMKKSKLDK